MNAKRILAGVAAVVVALGVAGNPGEVGAAPKKINQCKTLDEPGAWEVNRNLTATGDCLVVTADFITIDLAGFVLTGDGTGHGITDNGVYRKGVAVRNGTVTGFVDGIRLNHTSSCQIERVRAIGNTGAGIRVGWNCTVSGNITRENDTQGIAAAAPSTVSGNTVIFGTWNGIEVGCPSNVIGNTVVGYWANLAFIGDGSANTNNVTD
jgi:hypothetical protein